MNDLNITPSPVPPPDRAHLPGWHPALLIATFFYVGRLPIAPGTWASLIALPLAFGIYYLAGPPVLLLFLFYLGGLGWWASRVYVMRTRAEDPPEVVIDEIVAQMAIFMVVPPTWYNLILGFALFRLFDIWKPFPVSWADRKIKGGIGAMLDDLLAAAYAGGALWLINTIILHNAATPGAVMP